MEIRTKVVRYVQERVDELRARDAAKNPMSFQNISALETNAMKYLPNFFAKGQLEKIFFLYPDPHFQKSKYRRRVVKYAPFSLT
jgi:tRNA (guanine-N7-)-methyltransferase